MTVTRSYFSNNRSYTDIDHGGALYFDGDNISLTIPALLSITWLSCRARGYVTENSPCTHLIFSSLSLLSSHYHLGYHDIVFKT